MSWSSRWIEFLSPCLEEMLMAKTITLCHPKDPSTADVGDGETPKMCHARHSTFAAFGYASGVANVNGLLTGDQTGAPTKGRTYQQPDDDDTGFGFWIIVFEVKPAVVHANTTFTLELFEYDEAGAKTSLHTEPNIIVDDGFGGLAMSFPKTGDVICTHFAPYGTSDSSATVSAALSGGTMTSDFQERQKTPPPTNWVLSCYEPTAPQSGVTLTVSQSGQTDQVASNLTIRANCI
jgi:hypothetical protein